MMTPRHTARQIAFATIAVVIMGVALIMAIGTQQASAYDTCESSLQYTLGTTGDSLSEAYKASPACMSLSPSTRAQAARDVLG